MKKALKLLIVFVVGLIMSIGLMQWTDLWEFLGLSVWWSWGVLPAVVFVVCIFNVMLMLDPRAYQEQIDSTLE